MKILRTVIGGGSVTAPKLSLFNKKLLLTASAKAHSPVLSAQSRPFWQFLDRAWNDYDPKQVEKLGANRACAEWLLRCGASVKFKNWGSYVTDYNKLPPGARELYRIEEIRAENSCLMGCGFRHLNGLHDLRVIKLISCELVDNEALGKLAYVRESLEELQLVFCPMVTDVGLSYLYLLKNLKDLYINYLPSVVDLKLAEKLLRERLPDCRVTVLNEKELLEKMKNDQPLKSD